MTSIGKRRISESQRHQRIDLSISKNRKKISEAARKLSQLVCESLILLFFKGVRGWRAILFILFILIFYILNNKVVYIYCGSNRSKWNDWFEWFMIFEIIDFQLLDFSKFLFLKYLILNLRFLKWLIFIVDFNCVILHTNLQTFSYTFLRIILWIFIKIFQEFVKFNEIALYVSFELSYNIVIKV